MTKSVTPEAAATEATAAHQAVNDAEQAIASGKRVGIDRLTELAVKARHAKLTADATRDQADRDRERARQEALAELGSDIDALAAVGVEGLTQALADIADAAGHARRAAGAWDQHLAAVARTARELGCSAPATGGPRETDQRVAVRDDGSVYHAEISLKRVTSRLREALQQALDGDLVSAVASGEVVATVPVLARADHYMRGRGGLVVPVYGDLSEHQQYQVDSGSLVELNASQVRAYLAGDPVVLTKDQEQAYRRTR